MEETHTEDHEEHHKPNLKHRLGKWYNKNYRLLLLIPAILLILALLQLGYSYQQNEDFIKKDITLTGGTSITILTQDTEISTSDLSDFLSNKLEDFAVRELSDFRSGQQKAVIVESVLEPNELKPIVEEYLGYNLDSDNSSIESTGSSLGESFYTQLQIAIVISFILMAIIVFIIFRSLVPSTAVVISAFADIMMTLACVNLLGMKVSSAGITAILMLIGYSVDSDIMLTTRLLKRHGETNKNLLGAFKTGITMTLTSIIALSVALLITQSFSLVLKQIFIILLIGLGFDIMNTWITNVSILKWYLDSGGKKQ
jgi:preprotein translocase subunit SecF